MPTSRTTAKKPKIQVRALKVKSPVVAIPGGFVLVSRKHLERMQEDLHDLAVIAERRNEKTYSWEDLKARLGRDESA